MYVYSFKIILRNEINTIIPKYNGKIGNSLILLILESQDISINPHIIANSAIFRVQLDLIDTPSNNNAAKKGDLLQLYVNTNEKNAPKLKIALHNSLKHIFAFQNYKFTIIEYKLIARNIIPDEFHTKFRIVSTSPFKFDTKKYYHPELKWIINKLQEKWEIWFNEKLNLNISQDNYQLTEIYSSLLSSKPGGKLDIWMGKLTYTLDVDYDSLLLINTLLIFGKYVGVGNDPQYGRYKITFIPNKKTQNKKP